MLGTSTRDFIPGIELAGPPAKKKRKREKYLKLNNNSKYNENVYYVMKKRLFGPNGDLRKYLIDTGATGLGLPALPPCPMTTGKESWRDEVSLQYRCVTNNTFAKNHVEII